VVGVGKKRRGVEFGITFFPSGRECLPGEGVNKAFNSSFAKRKEVKEKSLTPFRASLGGKKTDSRGGRKKSERALLFFVDRRRKKKKAFLPIL